MKMKRNFLWMGLALSLFTYTCENPTSEDEEIQRGYLTLETSVNQGVVIKTGRLQEGATDEYSVTLTSGEGAPVVYDRFADIPSPLTLEVGTYDVSVSSGDFTAPAFDAPQYVGESTVAIVADTETPASVECKQANAAVNVMYTQAFKDKFTDYNTELVRATESLIYAKEETKTGYFLPGELTGKVMAGGNQYDFETPIVMEAQDLWTVTVDVEIVEETGAALLSISLNTAVNDKAVTWTVVPSTDPVEPESLELFISEYLEGSSNNKAIEIYNPTNAAIDLSNYKLVNYQNGSTSGTKITLTGSIEANSAYLVTHTSFGLTLPEGVIVDVESGSLGFNGKDGDAIALSKDDVNIDVFGEIGSSANFAGNETYRRNTSINEPNTTFTIGEWTMFSEDTADGLGSHTMD